MAGRILVLDDEENYAEMLQDLLREHNYQVDMATRPERAIDQLEEIPYDLVISDYKMPVMDGSDFLRKARELYPNLPFILVSGLMNTPELVKVANLSVTLVMEKPLDTASFLAHVAKFTEAMSPDERVTFDREAASGTSGAQQARSYPDEPRFFSACCAISKRFMQDAWSASLTGTSLFILEPQGGDASLAVKDLSIWRGNVDKPIQTVDFEDFTDGGAGKVKELLSHEEMSDVISIRLSSSDQIAEAQSHLERVLGAVDSAKSTLFVYLLEGTMSDAEFSEQTKSAGCILSALRKRPSDVAQYVRRFARLCADRSAKPKVAELTPEAAYAVVAFEWPGNYQQIQDVISAAVQKSEDTPMTLEVLSDSLGEVTVPATGSRLEAFVKKAQAYQFEDAMLISGDSAGTLARRLELCSNIQSEDDLRRLPLIDPKLATL
jgi:CheY-like chemotaxis protein